MRLAVLADVHGNLPALIAVLEDIQRRNVDGYLIGGDTLGGPHPDESIELLRALNGAAILGNTDINVLRYDAGMAPAHWQTHLQWAVLRWIHQRLRRESLEFLRSLPEQRVVQAGEAAPIHLVHGSPRDPYESLFPDLDIEAFDSVLAQIDEPVLVCGHTHIPWKLRRDGRLAFNPGAVGAPLNGDVRAQYALMDWRRGQWHVQHQAVRYDLQKIHTAFDESGFLQQGGALARAFLLSIETGQNVAEDFLSYAYGLATEAGFTANAVVPDPLWECASQTYMWPVSPQQAQR